MASSPRYNAAPWFSDESKPDNFALVARVGPTLVLNSDTLTATTNYNNPFLVLAGGHASHAKAYLWPTPIGCMYLDLFHEWKGTLGTLPVVRVYGEVPQPMKGSRFFPADVSSSNFYDPHANGYEDWIPLGDMRNGNWQITLGSATTPIALTNGTSNRSVPFSVNVRGTRKILVTVETAADTIDAGLIAGNFGR